jgi:hypothetical protein
MAGYKPVTSTPVVWRNPALDPPKSRESRLRILAVLNDTVVAGTFFLETKLFLADGGDQMGLAEISWWAVMPKTPEVF